MKTLFISYNSALEPLIQSQGIPYLEGLSKKGVECFLLSFEKTPLNKTYFKEKQESLKRRLEVSNIKWYFFKYHKRPTLPATLYDIFIGIIAGIWIVISKKINIVHARATVPAAMAYVIAFVTGARFIFDVRGMMAEEYVDGGMWKRGGFLYKLTRNVEKLLLKKSSAIVVLTENIREFLLLSDYLQCAHDNKKLDISVIPCCVDLKRFSDTIKETENLRVRYGLEDKTVLLYIGSFGTWYLLDEMLDFFLASKAIIRNAHFLILTHANKDSVKLRLIQRGLSQDDITVHEAEFSEIPAYIKLAQAGIFFIKPVLSKRSSCPIKFAEYLAGGLPVILNKGIGDTDKIVQEYRVGVVVSQFNRQSYLSGATELTKMMQERDELSERCKITAREIFSLDIGVLRYFNIYNKITQPG